MRRQTGGKTWESSPPVGNGTIQTWRERPPISSISIVVVRVFVVIVISSALSIGSLLPRLAPNINKTNQLMKSVVCAFPLSRHPLPLPSLQTLPLLEVNPIPKGKKKNKQTNRQNDNKHKVNPIPTPFITKAIYQTDTQQFYTKKRKQKISVFKENVEEDLLLGRSLW
jgi:hypothetical protein